MEASSESIAGDGVADRQREESEPDGQHDEVKHFDAPGGARRAEYSERLPAERRFDVDQLCERPVRALRRSPHLVCSGIAAKKCHLPHMISR
jgi:hypothetical protein